MPIQTEPAHALQEATRRQVAFRDVNENIAKLTAEWNETGFGLFICECSLPDCAESLEISAVEYENVRAHGTRFVVLPGHQLDGFERVVEGTSRFLVVEKLRHAAEIAEADNNPRRS